MSDQQSFASLAWSRKGKVTRGTGQQLGRKVIPEPDSSSMIAVGAGMLAWIARRAKRRASSPGFESIEWIGGRGFSRARSIFIVLVVLLAGSGLVAAQGAAQDMDSDGIPDAYEDSTIDGNTQTLDLDKTVPNDAQMDFDLDGVINLVEYQNNSAAWEFRDPLACGTLCHPIVNSFSIDKHLLLQTGPGQITVTWSTSHAEEVRIEPFGSVSPSGSATFSIEETTNVVLIATNSNSFRMDAEVVEYYAEQQNNTYDSASQRVLEKTPTLERIYVYGPSGEILSELNADGSPVVEYVYLEGEPIAQLHGAGNTGRYWVHTSHLGTPEMLTTTTREVAWKIRSRPFGETFGVSPSGTSVTQRGRFPGQLFDGATNLHYNWHRFYDPSIGRYISADPIGQRGGVNLYEYAHSNPASLTDPTGEIAFLPFIAAAAYAAIALDFALNADVGFNEEGGFSVSVPPPSMWKNGLPLPISWGFNVTTNSDMSSESQFTCDPDTVGDDSPLMIYAPRPHGGSL
ncbi:MAG: hypothetical protein IPK00_23455 [Deltaproteobacteria bacterium]|nr:hypothetical protein [Deltaproteobacteria bacterium]